jgi:hypothetical protein
VNLKTGVVFQYHTRKDCPKTTSSFWRHIVRCLHHHFGTASENGLIYLRVNGSVSIYAEEVTGFEGESLGGLGEKSILCGADEWVDKTVGEYTIV